MSRTVPDFIRSMCSLYRPFQFIVTSTAPFFKIVEDFLDRPAGDQLADADFLAGRERDHDQGVVGEKAEMVDGEFFAVVGLLLDIDNQAQALIGINDSITNLEAVHES